MNYKISNQTLFICDTYGNTGRRIADNVSFGTYDDAQKIFLVTSINGKVETRDINGNQIRTITENAIEARFSGTDLIIRKTDGRTEVRDRMGNLKRYL
ncbi:hypothetical protein [Flavobacterium aciduliphilum]|uniref:YD repeat-containing protein n=1 Tax=Flavobacterium aciduliphilum TaxID=1101402 RepID=A0A328YLP1_9FLAO|nr:hypothetical protein [Flavobacterium aciduliphilum]RAR73735.1 hypothetical protein CLV55_10354 [Flavobacterium aciduliphilum]